MKIAETGRKTHASPARRRPRPSLAPGVVPAQLGRDTNDSQRLSELAYQAILQGLFDGRIPVGAFVTQKDLVKLLRFPVQPLRDALLVLRVEGVLTIHPRSGVQFLHADSELARTTYQFRSIIERAGVRGFAHSAETTAIAILRSEHLELIKRIEADGVTAKHRGMLEMLDERMHASIVANLRNPMIDKVNRRLDNYVTVLHLRREITAPLAMQTLKEHLEILDACADRDADRAEAAIAAHLRAALLRVLAIG